MLASMHHVAASFGYLERRGEEWIGWGAAIAIDASIVVFTYGLRTRRKANRSKISGFTLIFGILFLTAISVAANLNAALMNRPGEYLMAIFFSATLPLIVILLSDIASSDDDRIAKKLEREERRREESTTVPVDKTESTESTAETIPDYETYTRFCEARNGDGAILPVELMGKYKVPKSSAYKWYGLYNSTHSEVETKAE
jgi:hypothetical protein